MTPPTELQVEAHETVLIGDSIHDIQMANSAGVGGRKLCTHPRERLIEHGAVTVIDELMGLPTVLQRIETAV